MAFLFPLAYLILVGWAWSATFKHRFSESIAPAIMLHVIILLFTGMIFHSLRVGIVIGGLLYLLLLLYYLVTGRSVIDLLWPFGIHDEARISVNRRIIENIKDILCNPGFHLLLIFYFFCWFSNIGKVFLAWDEFSHWGMFLKESLRLDNLYAVSPLPFKHKDYVPAITLFEVIWVKLCRRYLEADVYRAVQNLMFVMILPIFGPFEEHIAEMVQCNKAPSAIGKNIYGRLPVLGALAIVLLVPFIFNTSNAFYFYHSIYCDYASGIILFYCMLVACADENNFPYQIGIFTLALTVMVLTKMTLISMLPPVVLFFIIRKIWVSEERGQWKHIWAFVFPVAFSGITWFSFNKFVKKFIPISGSIQSYDSMDLSQLVEVFKSPTNSSITHLESVRRTFINAVFSRDVLIHGSYTVALGCIVTLMLILAYFQKDKVKRKLAYLVTL